MLSLLKAHVAKPPEMSARPFYGLWRQEAEAALAAEAAGAIKAIYKAAAPYDVVAILGLPSGDDLDRAIASLPMWSSGNSHVVKTLEITPLRPYENWAPDLRVLSDADDRP